MNEEKPEESSDFSPVSGGGGPPVNFEGKDLISFWRNEGREENDSWSWACELLRSASRSS